MLAVNYDNRAEEFTVIKGETRRITEHQTTFAAPPTLMRTSLSKVNKPNLLRYLGPHTHFWDCDLEVVALCRKRDGGVRSGPDELPSAGAVSTQPHEGSGWRIGWFASRALFT